MYEKPVFKTLLDFYSDKTLEENEELGVLVSDKEESDPNDRD